MPDYPIDPSQLQEQEESSKDLNNNDKKERLQSLAKDILGFIDRAQDERHYLGAGSLIKASRYLLQLGRKDLAEKIATIFLEENLQIALSEPKDPRVPFDDLVHNPYHAANAFWQFGKDGIKDARYNKIGRSLLLLSGAYHQDMGRYNEGATYMKML